MLRLVETKSQGDGRRGICLPSDEHPALTRVTQYNSQSRTYSPSPTEACPKTVGCPPDQEVQQVSVLDEQEPEQQQTVAAGDTSDAGDDSQWMFECEAAYRALKADAEGTVDGDEILSVLGEEGMQMLSPLMATVVQKSGCDDVTMEQWNEYMANIREDKGTQELRTMLDFIQNKAAEHRALSNGSKPEAEEPAVTAAPATEAQADATVKAAAEEPSAAEAEAQADVTAKPAAEEPAVTAAATAPEAEADVTAKPAAEEPAVTAAATAPEAEAQADVTAKPTEEEPSAAETEAEEPAAAEVEAEAEAEEPSAAEAETEAEAEEPSAAEAEAEEPSAAEAPAVTAVPEDDRKEPPVDDAEQAEVAVSPKKLASQMQRVMDIVMHVASEECSEEEYKSALEVSLAPPHHNAGSAYQQGLIFMVHRKQLASPILSETQAMHPKPRRWMR